MRYTSHLNDYTFSFCFRIRENDDEQVILHGKFVPFSNKGYVYFDIYIL